MKDFNAKKAREITDSTYKDELQDILVDIRKKSEQGESVLHIYKPLKIKTVDELKNKGFEIISSSSIAILRDNLYFSIKW